MLMEPLDCLILLLVVGGCVAAVRFIWKDVEGSDVKRNPRRRVNWTFAIFWTMYFVAVALALAWVLR